MYLKKSYSTLLEHLDAQVEAYFTYLGLPLGLIKPKIDEFLPIVNRCERRRFPPPFAFPKLADCNLKTMSSQHCQPFIWAPSPFMSPLENRSTCIEKTAYAGDQMSQCKSCMDPDHNTKDRRRSRSPKSKDLEWSPPDKKTTQVLQPIRYPLGQHHMGEII